MAMTGHTAGMTEPSPESPVPARRPFPWLVAVAALFVGFVLGAGATALAFRPPHLFGPDEDAQTIKLCQDAIRAQLKAPATAKFSGDHVLPGGGLREIHGNVDSENGFSALIRSQYTCILDKNGKGQWSVLNATAS